MTGILFGLTLIAAGAAIIRGGAMSRWAGWAAVVIGCGSSQGTSRGLLEDVVGVAREVDALLFA